MTECHCSPCPAVQNRRRNKEKFSQVAYLITTVSTIPGIFLTCVGSDCWVASMILTVGFRARFGEGVGVVGAAGDIAARRLPLALLPCPLVTTEVTAPPVPVEVMNVVLGFWWWTTVPDEVSLWAAAEPEIHAYLVIELIVSLTS